MLINTVTPKDLSGRGWQPGANTLAYWKFNQNLDNSCSSGVTLTGYVYGYSSTAIEGYSIIGVNGYQPQSSLTQGDVFGGAFTIAFFVNMQNTATLQRLFKSTGAQGIDIQYEFYNDFSGFQVYNIETAVRIAFPMNNPGVGVWKSLVLTGDGVNQIELYIDGVKTSPYSNYNTTFIYPNYSYSFGFYWGDSTNVLMDEVVVENKHWTQTDVNNYLGI